MNIKATIIGEHVMQSKVKGRTKIIEDAIDACVTMEPEWTDDNRPTILQIAKFVDIRRRPPRIGRA